MPEPPCHHACACVAGRLSTNTLVNVLSLASQLAPCPPQPFPLAAQGRGAQALEPGLRSNAGAGQAGAGVSDGAGSYPSRNPRHCPSAPGDVPWHGALERASRRQGLKEDGLQGSPGAQASPHQLGEEDGQQGSPGAQASPHQLGEEDGPQGTARMQVPAGPLTSFYDHAAAVVVRNLRDKVGGQQPALCRSCGCASHPRLGVQAATD